MRVTSVSTSMVENLPELISVGSSTLPPSPHLPLIPWKRTTVPLCPYIISDSDHHSVDSSEFCNPRTRQQTSVNRKREKGGSHGVSGKKIKKASTE